MQKILVAIDGSESCYKAAKKAEELALLCQASLTFITIVDPKLKLLTSKEKLKNRNENIKQEVEKSRRILDRCESIYGKCKESIEDNNIKIHKPKGILTNAWTLFKDQKKFLEKVFECDIYNMYGSRETWDIACSNGGDILYTSFWSNFVEILDENWNSVQPWQSWRVCVTNLNNFCMPLIRYDLWDIAVKWKEKFQIEEVKWRIQSFLKDEKGNLIDGWYFRQLLYKIDNIEKYQIVQEDYNYIVFKIVLSGSQNIDKSDKDFIKENVKKVMWNNCNIKFEFLDDIPPTSSWKYLFVFSKIIENE